MPGVDVEQLNIQLTSDTSDAVDALDSLIGKLERLNTTDLSGVTSSFAQLAKMAESIGKLGNASTSNIVATGKAVSTLVDHIRGVDFGDLSQLQVLGTAIGKLHTAGRNGQSVVAAGQAIKILADYLREIEGYGNVTAVTELAVSISKLANAGKNGQNIVVAGQSMKLLADSLREVEVSPAMLQTLSQLAASIASIASKTGKRYSEDFTALATGLERLFQVLARAPTVDDNLVKMVDAIGRLDAESVKAANGLSRMSDSAQKSAVSVRDYADRTKHASVSTHSFTTRLAFAIGKFRQIYFVVRRIARLFAKMVDSAMDYVETLNYFNAAFDQVASRADDVFGQAGQEAGSAFTNRFAEEAAKLTEKMSGYAVSASGMVTNTMGTTLGMNPATMMNYQATFAQMASSMGVSSEMATDLSRALTEIGADLASVKNLGFEDTWKNLQSGLVGMSRAVDKYGLNIRNVNLQQKLMELGIDANIQEMNQQDKALLRTIIILENSQYAWGDLADTLQQPANQVRMLKSGIANLGRTIGNLFLPIVAAALPYINAFVVALQKMFEMLVNLMGIEFDWGSVGGAAINSEWADYLDDTTDSLGEATKAAEEWKNQILGFDEINKLGSESSDSGSGSGAGSNPYVSLQLENALRLALERYQKVWDESYASVNNRVNDIALKIIEWFGNIKKAVEPTTTALKKLWDDVFVPLGKWKWEVLKDFYNDFLKPVGQWVIGEGIPKLVEILIKLYEKIDWEYLREALDKAWRALAPFATAYFDGFIKFIDALVPLASLTFEAATNFISNVSELIIGLNPKTLELLAQVLGAAAGMKVVGGLFGLGGLGSLFGLGGKTALGGGVGKTGLSALLKGYVLPVVGSQVAGMAAQEIIKDVMSDGGEKPNKGGSLWGEWLAQVGASAGIGAAAGAKFGLPGMLALSGASVLRTIATYRDSSGEMSIHKVIKAAGFTVALTALARENLKAFAKGISVEELRQMQAEQARQAQEIVEAQERKNERDSAQRERERAARRIFRNKELTANIWNQLAYDTDREVDIFGNRENQAINRHEAEVDTLRKKNMSMRRQQLVGAWQELSNGVVSVIQTRFPWITGELQRKMIEQKTVVAKSASDTKNAYVNGFNGIGDGVANALSGIDKAIAKSQMARDGEARKAGAAAKKAFTDTFNPIGTEVTNVLNGINSKIGSTLSYATVRAGLGGVVSAFNNAFGDAANAALTQYNSMASSMNTATVNNVRAVNFSKVPMVKYANGGFPEDGFFFANSTEMVGRFANGRTAVANNEQIIAGIEGGVARGMAQAIMSTANATGGTNGQPVQVVISVDSETLYRATLRGESKYNNRYHMTVRG